MERFKPNSEIGESVARRTFNTDRENYSPQEEWVAEQEMIRSVLGNFNESVLHEILLDLAGKSGVDTLTVDLPSFNQIKISIENDILSSGHSSRSEMVINETNIPRDDNKVSAETVLWVMIHEYLHQLSTDNIHEDYVINENYYKGTHSVKSGVAINEINNNFDLKTGEQKKENIEINKYVNEGITEWLTGRVFDEYIKRVGDSEMRNKDALKQVEGIRGAYWVERLNVELYILFLSELLEQPVSVVENSITRTYIRNGQIVPEDILDVLNIKPDNRASVLNLIQEHINEPDFAELMVDLKDKLPKNKQHSFHQSVVTKFNQVADAVEVNNKNFI